MARQDMNDRKKRKTCSFCADHVEYIDYKDASKLKRYLTMLLKEKWISEIGRNILVEE